MGFTIRVSLPGNDCLTDTNIRNYSLYADSDNVLIKEFSRGSGSVSYNSIGTVTHNLGYIPFYLAYTQVGTSRYRIANAYDPVGSGWRAYTGTAGLMLQNLEGTAFTGYKYFIFYDDMGGTV